jgi:hypothetical protein
LSVADRADGNRGDVLRRGGAEPAALGRERRVGDSVVMTVTGFEKGKVIGTLEATPREGALPGGAPIQASATFAAGCSIL